MKKVISFIVILLIVAGGAGVVYLSQESKKDQSAESSSAAVNDYPNLAGSNTKYATIFFHWHWCQADHPDEETANWRKEICEAKAKELTYLPPGFLEKDTKFGWYDEKNYDWVLGQLKDMETSSLDYVFVDTWRKGKIEWEPSNLVNITPNIKKAIGEKQTNLKFGLFIETGGVKWDYEDIKNIPDAEHINPLSLSSYDDADLLIDVIFDELDYFFTEIPRESWAIDKNGRPYVLIFDYQNFFLTENSKKEYLPYILAELNLKFEAKFGIKPALQVIWEWLYNDIDYSRIYNQHMTKQVVDIYGTNFNEEISKNIAGAFSWSTYGFPQSININDSVIGNVSPGFNKCNWLSVNDPSQGNNCYSLTNVNKVYYRKEGSFLEENFLGLNSKASVPFDLIIFETWGETFEGTTFQRALNYPKYDAVSGKDMINECNANYTNPLTRSQYCLSEDFYINKLKELLTKYGRARLSDTNTISENNGCVNQDSNNDGKISLVDLSNLLSKYNTNCEVSDEDYGACGSQDSNNDGKISLVDLSNLLSKYNKSCN